MARTIPTAPPAPSPTAGLPAEPPAAGESPRPGVAVYAVRAPFTTVTVPGRGPHSPAQDLMLRRGDLVPAWVPPAQVAHLERTGLVEQVSGPAAPVAEPPSAPAPAAPPAAPARWEGGRRYRVTAAAVAVPGRGSPFYRGQTLPADVDHATITRLLERGLVEPKRLPA